MTSVARKVHIPRLADSRCWAGVSKWCARRGEAVSATEVLRERIMVGPFGHDRDRLEVVLGRGRRGLPLQARGIPRIRAGLRADPERKDQVDEWEQVPD